MQTDHNTIDPESMDKASPEFAAYAKSLRPANPEPEGIRPPTFLDNGWTVVLEVETAEWRVITSGDYLRRQMGEAEQFALNFHPNPHVAVFQIDGDYPLNRQIAYGVAAALEGLVAPLETPWPAGTRDTIENRSVAVVDQWQKWMRAENEHYEAKAVKRGDPLQRELSAKQLAYRNLA